MTRTCKQCGEAFVLRADHKGLSTVCPGCSDGDIDRVMGKVAWSGKHTMELEITSDRRAAERFNRAQRRYGAGVTASLTEPRESSKAGSGAEAGAVYRTRFGEKRTVKG
jgi:hypothetical protein